MTRRLIVNADDYGQSPGVNRGVERAAACGIVRSASLMVRWDAAEPAAAHAARTGLDLGLHVDLGEWSCEDGRWRAVYEVVDLTDPSAVAAEVRDQVERFERLTGRAPTHVDSHQHVHRRAPVAYAVAEVALRAGVPLRGASEVHHCGAFYGQMADGAPLPDLITADALVALIRSLPHGTTELGCHPGVDVELDTMYRGEREAELDALCDRRVRDVLDAEGVELTSFARLA